MTAPPVCPPTLGDFFGFALTLPSSNHRGRGVGGVGEVSLQKCPHFRQIFCTEILNAFLESPAGDSNAQAPSKSDRARGWGFLATRSCCGSRIAQAGLAIIAIARPR